LKNSKIAGLRKSRKCSALAIPAVARLCGIDTSASNPSPRSERDAPAVLRIFSHQRKGTFSTQSAKSGITDPPSRRPPKHQSRFLSSGDSGAAGYRRL